MRIALISTPFVAVPPPAYGGTELVVSELASGFIARGHEVTLFATGDSSGGSDLRSIYDRPEWPPHPYPELGHAAFSVEQILGDRRGFDVIHAHVPSAVPFARLVDVPMVYTVHHQRDDRLSPIYARSRAQLVAISERQRELSPELEQAAVIHHGVSVDRYRFGAGGEYAAFLGRLACEKGPHHAIDAALAARVPLRMAGRPHSGDDAFFAAEVEPRLRPGAAELVGAVGGDAKTQFLRGACALLFPIEWEEPFGLVMIEAMLCGTPVLAFDRGSVREVIDEGLTGFICRDVDEMASRLRAIAATSHPFNRRRCAARARLRWSAERMVSDHLRLYLELLGAGAQDARAATPRA